MTGYGENYKRKNCESLVDNWLENNKEKEEEEDEDG